ncbi:predicted protein [Naegleria gruberi]|uniref:Predicted protein n=1 Tax=Naegleria gruberi TaxID=5762 RepID=D2W6C8_NAEGR|nr:uncharacterized protein NAEGRDRAFT_76971 [Naegleria gruberi]EFC35374.1 predicted protein [Naegleria gruberi]|eukprot:XP_002668118.1 predicted protein [Naegleria gruberi strain NEG-M]
MSRDVIVIQDTTIATVQVLNKVVVQVGTNSFTDVIIICSVVCASCLILILVGIIALYLCILRKKRRYYLQREDVDTESQHMKRQLVFHTSKLSDSESSLVTVKVFF